jgi:hypothetical protein
VSPQRSTKKGSADDWLWIIVTDCDYEWLYKEDVNKSNNPIQKPVIIGHVAIDTWQYVLRSLPQKKYQTNTKKAIFLEIVM